MRKKWFVLYENSDRSMETRSVEENKMTRRKTEESTHDHFNNSMVSKIEKWRLIKMYFSNYRFSYAQNAQQLKTVLFFKSQS